MVLFCFVARLVPLGPKLGIDHHKLEPSSACADDPKVQPLQTLRLANPNVFLVKTPGDKETNRNSEIPQVFHRFSAVSMCSHEPIKKNLTR